MNVSCLSRLAIIAGLLVSLATPAIGHSGATHEARSAAPRVLLAKVLSLRAQAGRVVVTLNRGATHGVRPGVRGVAGSLRLKVVRTFANRSVAIVYARLGATRRLRAVKLMLPQKAPARALVREL